MKAARRVRVLVALVASLALAGPASAAASDGASGFFHVLNVQNGIMHLLVSVTPGSGACQPLGSINDCDWYAYVDVESAPGGNCALYATGDPSGTLSSQTDANPQSASEPLDAQVASGQCMLILRYDDLSGASQILAQQPYTFPSPSATFTDVNGTPPVAGSLFGSLSASASVVLSEPVCPSDGACSWFGYVIIEPASVGCPAEIAPGAGPTPVWVGDVLDSPGTEGATLSHGWSITAGPLLWCGYIDGPGVQGSGASLVGQATYTSPFAGPPPPPVPPPAPAPTSKPKPKYTMTLANIRGWAWSAAVDQFYRARASTRLTAFRVRGCTKSGSGRFRCTVSWRKNLYAFAGTVTMGGLNGRTGHFEFGFSLTRRNTMTGTRKSITVRY